MPAQGPHAGTRPVGQRALRIATGGVQPGWQRDLLAPGLAVAPARLRQIVGDGAEHVGLAGPDVAPAVALEVDRVAQVAGRHELRLAHRACIGAGHRRGHDIAMIQDLQRGQQFASEKAGSAAVPGQGSPATPPRGNRRCRCRSWTPAPRCRRSRPGLTPNRACTRWNRPRFAATACRPSTIRLSVITKAR